MLLNEEEKLTYNLNINDKICMPEFEYVLKKNDEPDFCAFLCVFYFLKRI